MKRLILPLLFVGCAQSTIVLDPTTNKAVTPTVPSTQNTLTLNVDMSLAGSSLFSKPFSALVFLNGALVAAQYNSGATTDGAGLATFVMNGVDTNNCPTATPAALAFGTYQVYYAMQYAAETVTTVAAGKLIDTSLVACSANGFIQSSSGAHLYNSVSNIVVSGNATVNINSTTTVPGSQHTFSLSVGNGILASKLFRCYLTDSNTTAIAATLQPLALYTGSTDASGLATTTGNGVTNFPVATSYKYYCLIGVASATNFLATGNYQATGVATVTGYATTTLTAANFTAL